MELVSVIIPVFNVAPFLAEALESVINQSYQNLEIIIIDDGSTDECGSICDEYAKRDNRVVTIHQENKGLSNARNIGLDIMTGDIVAFLDSDDAYHVDYIKCMLLAMKYNEVDLVSCRIGDYDTLYKMQSHNVLKDARPTINQGLLDHTGALRALVESSDYQVWNKIYRKKLWKGIRFPNGHVYEDIDTIYRVIDRCGKAFVMDKQLYMHRLRSDSISSICSQCNILDRVRACQHLEAFVEANTPEVFSEDHKIRLKQLRLNHMIDQYVHNFTDFGKADLDFREKFRNQITELRYDVGNVLGRKKEIICFMICHCPWLFEVLYPMYRKVTQVKRYSRAATGRRN